MKKDGVGGLFRITSSISSPHKAEIEWIRALMMVVEGVEVFAHSVALPPSHHFTSSLFPQSWWKAARNCDSAVKFVESWLLTFSRVKNRKIAYCPGRAATLLAIAAWLGDEWTGYRIPACFLLLDCLTLQLVCLGMYWWPTNEWPVFPFDHQGIKYLLG